MDFRSAAAAGLCLPPLGMGNGLPVGPAMPSLLTPGLPPSSSLTTLSHAAAGLTSGMYMYTAPATIATGSQITTSVQQGLPSMASSTKPNPNITSFATPASLMKPSSSSLNIPNINSHLALPSRHCDTPMPMTTTVPTLNNNASSLKLTDTSQNPQASSFAAALRSLAKNASSVNVHSSQGASTTEQSNSVISSSQNRLTNPSSENTLNEDNVTNTPNLSTVLGSNDIMPTNPGVSATLLDVRKGFDRSPSNIFLPSSTQSSFPQSTGISVSSTTSLTSNNLMTSSTVSRSDSLSFVPKSAEQIRTSSMSTNEVVGSGFQPYKASSLSDASKLMPPPPPSPYPPPAYGYPSTLFSGPPLHAYSLEADALYRAHLERYAASLAAASGTPPLGLGATSAISPYTMLAAGYAPSAIGLIPPPPMVQTTIPETASSACPPSLNLSQHQSKVTSTTAVPNHNQSPALAMLPQLSTVNSNQNAASELAATSSTSVLQQRLSAPVESLRNKQVSSLDTGPKNSLNSLTGLDSSLSSEIGVVKEANEPKKEKKKTKSGSSNKGRTSANSIPSASMPSFMSPSALPASQNDPSISTPITSLTSNIKTQSSRQTINSDVEGLVNSDDTSRIKTIVHESAENTPSSFGTSSTSFSSPSISSSSFSMPLNPSLTSIQLPTKPLDISEVTEFSSRNIVSSQPPANVTSTLENIVTSKPSTVSLLRGMRLKKCLQTNGLKLDAKNNILEGQNDKDGNEKMTFVRPFEDSYTCATKSKSNTMSMSEIVDNSYSPPEYEITENSIRGDINVSIPVSLESNLKHINSKNKADVETKDVYNKMANNNSSAFPSQMSKTSKPKKSKKRKCDNDAKESAPKESKSKKPSKKQLLDKESSNLSLGSKGTKEKSREKFILKSVDAIKPCEDSSENSKQSLEHTTDYHENVSNSLAEDVNRPNFVEPNTKEKLRYLRYFRLITHRKRNDVEIEKLERRKVRYKEDSLGPLKSSFSRIETPFPQLPLPSVSPMSSNLGCTKEKVVFMNKLGLKRVAPKEKKENELISNVVMDSRLARGSINKTLLYCIRLRDMDEEVSSIDNTNVEADTFSPPKKRSRMCNDNVFLAPLEPSLLKIDKEKDPPAIKKCNFDNDSLHLLLPKVPCLTPPTFAANSSASSLLTAHLSHTQLQIPPFSFDSHQQKMDLPSQTNITTSMPDILTLINTQNNVTNSIVSSNSSLQQAMEPKSTFSNSINGIVSHLSSPLSNSFKLPINLSTLVPVSKHSLKMEDVDKAMSPMPMTTTNHASTVDSNSQNPYISPFSINTLSGLSPLLPAISPQIQNVSQAGTVCPVTPSSMSISTTKESKPSSTNRRGRSIQNSLSSGTSLTWPGVDVIVESYRKYNQECSAEAASLQQQIQCLQQELSTKRAHVDSLSNQMASLIRHQKGVKQLNENIESQIKIFESTLNQTKES